MKSSKAASLHSELLFIIALLTYPTLDAHGLIRLSQVCHHWRHTLLSSPRFWSNITYPNLKIPLINMILTRSADYPLQVTFCLSFGGEELAAEILACWDLIFAHANHLETLVLSGFWRGTKILDHILSSFKEPASKFKVFRFIPDSYSETSPNPVLKDFLYKIASGLDELSLTSVFIPSEMPIFQSITRLFIRHADGITSMAQLFDILEAPSKNLTILDITLPEFSLELDDEELDDNRSFQLSSLRSLTLMLDSVVLLLLLDRVEVPSDIDWDIHLFGAMVQLELDVTPLLRFFRHVRSGPFLNLILEHYGDEVVMEFGQSIDAPHHSSLVMHLCTSTDDALDCFNRVQELFASLDISKVDCCRIIISETHPEWLFTYEETLGSLFILFSGIQELILHYKGGEYRNALLPLIDQLRPGQTFQVPCPLLDNLTLDPVPTKDKSWIQILNERKAAGNILTHIKVSTEPYDQGIKEELEMLAKNVTYASNSATESNGNAKLPQID